MKKYTNADLAQDYLKIRYSSYETSLKIDSAKIDIPKYFSENKRSLMRLELEGISEYNKGRLEQIMAKREERALKSKILEMRKKQNNTRKLNYKLIPHRIGREDDFP